jgi:hypothetical protein
VGPVEGVRGLLATRSGRLTVGLLTAVVVLLVIGSVGAFAIARHQRGSAGVAAPDPAASRLPPHPQQAPGSSASGATSTAGQGTQQPVRSTGEAPPASSSAASPMASASTDAGPAPETDPATAPVGPSNNLTVQLSPSTRTHARSQDVQQVLQTYFDAINQHDYSSWTQSVTKTLASHQTGQQWLLAYATTVDSSIWMQSMRDDPLQVQIHFTSQQDPDLAPVDLKVGCIHWTLTYQLADQDGRLAIGSTVDGSVDYVKC